MSLSRLNHPHDDFIELVGAHLSVEQGTGRITTTAQRSGIALLTSPALRGLHGMSASHFHSVSTYKQCAVEGHLYEVITLDGKPVLESSLLQVIDPATRATVVRVRSGQRVLRRLNGTRQYRPRRAK
jgi:hypothetical protein